MKTKLDENNFWHTPRERFRQRAKRRNPTLVLKMSNFNFTHGWGRTCFGYEYVRFNA
jgi:hypothetical protein